MLLSLRERSGGQAFLPMAKTGFARPAQQGARGRGPKVSILPHIKISDTFLRIFLVYEWAKVYYNVEYLSK